MIFFQKNSFHPQKIAKIQGGGYLAVNGLIRLEQLQQILDHNKNTKEYFCSFKGDIEVDWITILDDNHPLVMQYFKQINEPLPLHSVQNPTWMKPVWHTD